MKRDLKLNMEHLSGTVDSIQNYLDRTEQLETACTAFLEILKKQDSVSYNTLSEEWEKDIIGYIGEIEERLTQMKTMLEGYIENMESYIAPESRGAMMRVDRNDIWYNISQIGSGISKVFDISCDSGSSFPDYKHFFINWWSKEADAIRAEEEREKHRRERNYDKLASFRSNSVSSAFRLFGDEVDAIWDIYNNAIVPFENTDDDYSDEARFWYGMWATTGNELEDVGNGIKNLGRGLWDAAVDLVDGVFSLALYLVFGGFVFSGVVSLPDAVEERCRGVDAGIQAILKDPLGVIEAMGQSMTDTYEEEGLAYAVGYISLDVIAEIAATKGAGGAKGAAKAADTAADAAGAAKKVDTVTDAAGTAKTADTATDAAGAVYTVDKVEETADAAKTADTAKTADGLEVKGGTGGSSDTVAYHSVGGEKSEKKIQSVLDGIDISYTSPDSRFGQGFYVAADGNTTVAELAYHGTDATYSIRYDMNLEGQRVLDLTDPAVANEWGYLQGKSSLLECQNIAGKALDEGYSVIKVQSYRDRGINYVIYDNFDEILQPQMVTPIGE